MMPVQYLLRYVSDISRFYIFFDKVLAGFSQIIRKVFCLEGLQ